MIDTLTIHRGLCQCDSGCDKGCKSYDETSRNTPPTEDTSGSDAPKTASPITCTCKTCEAGTPVPMDEWLKNPTHAKMHEQICAALKRGEIHVIGENE